MIRIRVYIDVFKVHNTLLFFNDPIFVAIFLLVHLVHGVMSVLWKIEAGVWNQGIYRILFWFLSILYVEIILEAMISRFFHPDVSCDVSVGEQILSLNVTVVLLT